MIARRITLAMAGFLAALLGWGYWHASSHADLSVSLYDVAGKADGRAYASVVSANLRFNDAAGRTLADGALAPPWGVVSMVHPLVGDCRREERDGGAGWRQCFDAQSQWLSTWVPRVRTGNVRVGSCAIEEIPVVVNTFRDAWWIWWIPLPHAGGTPYTHYSLTLWIDSARCRPATAPSS